MTVRIHNCKPGPAALPLPVLEQVQRDLLDYAGTGMSILEMNHRSTAYERLHNQAMADLRTLLGGTEDHAIVFMGGGAQTQFALVALNLLPPGSYAEEAVCTAQSAHTIQMMAQTTLADRVRIDGLSMACPPIVAHGTATGLRHQRSPIRLTSMSTMRSLVSSFTPTIPLPVISSPASSGFSDTRSVSFFSSPGALSWTRDVSICSIGCP